MLAAIPPALSPGVLALAAIFGAAALLIARQAFRGRAIRRRLLESGFVPCDQEAPSIREALARVDPGFAPGAPRTYEVGRCFKRAGGRGVLYRFAAVDRTSAQSSDRNLTGARTDIYLLDLPDAERVAHGPVSVFLAPGPSAPLRALLAGLVKLDPHGVPLELSEPQTRRFLAAFSDRPGRLDDRLPAATQERLSRGVEAGFLCAHFGAGKLGLVAMPERTEIDRELAYVAEWA
jgi:hypothetical protein